MKNYYYIIVMLFNFFLFNSFTFANYESAILAYKDKDWNKVKVECKNNDDDRCLNLLGILYLRGLGVEINYKKSMELFLKAERMDNKNAMHNIGIMYMKGFGREQDLELASQYFNKVYLDKSVYQKNKQNIEAIDSEKTLLKLSSNSILAKYAVFYTNYLKYKVLKESKFNKRYLSSDDINFVENKYIDIKKRLFAIDIKIDQLNSQILDEQKIIIMLYEPIIKDIDNYMFEKNKILHFIKTFEFD